MSPKRLTRSACTLLVITGAAAALTGGIAVAQDAHRGTKSPPGSGSVSVSGHTIRMIPSGPRSTGSAQGKKSSPVSGSESVSGHTVHVTP